MHFSPLLIPYKTAGFLKESAAILRLIGSAEFESVVRKTSLLLEDCLNVSGLENKCLESLSSEGSLPEPARGAI